MLDQTEFKRFVLAFILFSFKISVMFVINISIKEFSEAHEKNRILIIIFHNYFSTNYYIIQQYIRFKFLFQLDPHAYVIMD